MICCCPSKRGGVFCVFELTRRASWPGFQPSPLQKKEGKPPGEGVVF